MTFVLAQLRRADELRPDLENSAFFVVSHRLARLIDQVFHQRKVVHARSVHREKYSALRTYLTTLNRHSDT